MLPVDPQGIRDEAQLLELLQDIRYTAEYKAKVAERIVEVRADAERLQRHREEAAKRAPERALPKPKAKGTLDGRSVKHAVSNGARIGAAPTLIGAWATYRELKAEGLAPSPDTVYRVFLGLSPVLQLIVAAGIGIAMTAVVLTLIDRYGREFK